MNKLLSTCYRLTWTTLLIASAYLLIGITLTILHLLWTAIWVKPGSYTFFWIGIGISGTAFITKFIRLKLQDLAVFLHESIHFLADLFQGKASIGMLINFVQDGGKYCGINMNDITRLAPWIGLPPLICLVIWSRLRAEVQPIAVLAFGLLWLLHFLQARRTISDWSNSTGGYVASAIITLAISGLVAATILNSIGTGHLAITNTVSESINRSNRIYANILQGTSSTITTVWAAETVKYRRQFHQKSTSVLRDTVAVRKEHDRRNRRHE